MSSIATLNEQLQQYEALRLHYIAKLTPNFQYVSLWQHHRLQKIHANLLNQYLQQIEAWQHQRIEKLHTELFNKNKNQAMKRFFFERLYNISSFNELADQLKKASDEQIKLERFVSENVMKTAEMGLQLGLMTLHLDLQLAFFCLENQLAVNDESMLKALIHCQQLQLRQEQLGLLMKLGEAFHQYSKSMLIQVGLSLAKNTANRRGFQALFEYLTEGFAAMRPLPSVKQFFESFIEGELAILEYIDGFHAFPPSMQVQTTE